MAMSFFLSSVLEGLLATPRACALRAKRTNTPPKSTVRAVLLVRFTLTHRHSLPRLKLVYARMVRNTPLLSHFPHTLRWLPLALLFENDHGSVSHVEYYLQDGECEDCTLPYWLLYETGCHNNSLCERPRSGPLCTECDEDYFLFLRHCYGACARVTMQRSIVDRMSRMSGLLMDDHAISGPHRYCDLLHDAPLRFTRSAGHAAIPEHRGTGIVLSNSPES